MAEQSEQALSDKEQAIATLKSDYLWYKGVNIALPMDGAYLYPQHTSWDKDYPCGFPKLENIKALLKTAGLTEDKDFFARVIQEVSVFGGRSRKFPARAYTSDHHMIYIPEKVAEKLGIQSQGVQQKYEGSLSFKTEGVTPNGGACGINYEGTVTGLATEKLR